MNGAEGAASTLSMAEIGSTLLAVAERARIGLVITAIHEGAIGPLYLSGAAVQILGRSRGEIMSGNLLDFIADEERARAVDLVRRLMAREVTSPLFETVVVQESGRRVPVEVTFVQITHGDRVLTVNVLVDISARKRLEEQLARSDRLAALGTLAARVAHEINNPLAFIALNVEALARTVGRRIEDDAARSDALATIDEIREGANRVATIVRDLRTLSRDEESESEPTDVWKVVASAEHLATHEVGPRARVSLETSPLPPVDASAFRLEQVFVNLLLNAAQAFPMPSDENLVHVSGGVLDNGSVYVDVKDNGAGIPPDVITRIFDPFFTTKPVGVGTGLGLAISHGIVARMGGELTVQSTLGQGSTFRVVLPPSRRHVAAEASRGAAPVETAARARVLVVDDEIGIGRSIKRLLESEHDVDVETSGEGALDRLLAGASYDVILCDVMMCGMSGVDVYERLVRARPGAERSVAFMTGGAVSEEARVFLDRVPNLRLDKPFSVGALRQALRTVMAR